MYNVKVLLKEAVGEHEFVIRLVKLVCKDFGLLSATGIADAIHDRIDTDKYQVHCYPGIEAVDVRCGRLKIVTARKIQRVKEVSHV